MCRHMHTPTHAKALAHVHAHMNIYTRICTHALIYSQVLSHNTHAHTHLRMRTRTQIKLHTQVLILTHNTVTFLLDWHMHTHVHVRAHNSCEFLIVTGLARACGRPPVQHVVMRGNERRRGRCVMGSLRVHYGSSTYQAGKGVKRIL